MLAPSAVELLLWHAVSSADGGAALHAVAGAVHGVVLVIELLLELGWRARANLWQTKRMARVERLLFVSHRTSEAFGSSGRSGSGVDLSAGSVGGG